MLEKKIVGIVMCAISHNSCRDVFNKRSELFHVNICFD
jgi:hypothetical protein